ncbi:cysteine hydrolase family protein [Kitasatospora fiedleri]|uniref:cysteine hydrolase family protein n=1 Tax=Kitasatospora fiedleri TaxID=2991545 RepID=UPI000C2C69CC|nr:cysteine hydrolase [Kitasatospora fiedleri]
MTSHDVPALVPARTALLAMDFQNGIVPIAPEPEALLARVREAAARVRAAGGTVAHVRVAFTEEDWAAASERNRSFGAVAANRALHHLDEATQFHPGLAPLEGDIVVRKVRIGAGSTTDLYERLAARGVDTLVLSGISTSGVVLSTLLDAADRDYRLYVLSDGVAARDPEVHRVLLEKVFPSRAHVIDTARLAELLG